MRQPKHHKATGHAKQAPEELKKEKESNVFLVMSLIILGAAVAVLLIVTFVKYNSVQTLEILDSPVLGNADAPVIIFEFSDFSCPYCSAAEGKNTEVINYLKSRTPGWEAPMPLIKEKYVDTGKVKIVFKYAAGHGTGIAAHLVGWCLNEQKLFWQFKDLAFANQNDVGNLEKMKTLASSLGADSAKLNSCLDSGKYNSYLERDNKVASSFGVRGTPAFIINGKLVTGAQSFSIFEQIIEAELSK